MTHLIVRFIVEVENKIAIFEDSDDLTSVDLRGEPDKRQLIVKKELEVLRTLLLQLQETHDKCIRAYTDIFYSGVI